jgi:murein DD-endopeptidase MepM/ murein hydrolase activator NlpD
MVKPIYITLQDEFGRPKVLRIPLWIVLAPILAVAILGATLQILWNSPWSPSRLRDQLAITSAKNERLRLELERGEAGLSAARKAIQLDAAERDRLRALAGIQSAPSGANQRSGLFSRDSVPDVGGLLARAKTIRQGYDQMIDWFQKHPGELGRLPTIRPVRADHPLVGDFGRQTDPFTGQAVSFPGLTWAVPVGTPVWATGAGTILAVGDQPRWGKYVEIRHDDRVVTVYTHLSRIDVKPDASVNRGQVIGLSGQSGKVIAPALFYAVFLDREAIDPTEFLLPEGTGVEPAATRS